MARREELTDEQWALIAPLFEKKDEKIKGYLPCDFVRKVKYFVSIILFT